MVKIFISLLFRRSTRPEVAQVQLVNSTDGNCAQTALVSAMSKTSHQMTTVVLAENKGYCLFVAFFLVSVFSFITTYLPNLLILFTSDQIYNIVMNMMLFVSLIIFLICRNFSASNLFAPAVFLSKQSFYLHKITSKQCLGLHMNQKAFVFNYFSDWRDFANQCDCLGDCTSGD